MVGKDATSPPKPPRVDPAAFAAALRVAILIPLLFAFCLEVLDDPEVAPFAFFGAIALLTFVDFGGSRRQRLLAYVGLVVAGTGLVALGTLCSSNAVVATVAMAVVGFAILISGVLGSYVATGSRAMLLAFVLPVMIPLTQDDLASRLAGWLLGTGVSVAALMLPWPKPRPDRLREQAVAAVRSLADAIAPPPARALAEPAPSASPRPAEMVGADDDARAAVASLGRAYLATPGRPTGVGGRSGALGRLIDDVVWLTALPLPQVPQGGAASPVVRRAAEARATVADALRASAGVLADGESAPPDLAALDAAGDRNALARAATRGNAATARNTAAPAAASRLRMLACAARRLADDALRAAGRRRPDGGESQPGAPRTVRELAAAHATRRSMALRNSLRGAIGLSIAVLVGHVADVQHAFWVVLGTLAVLRSQAAATGVTFVQEVAGTAAGIVVGGLLVLAIGTDTAVLWAIFPVVVLVANYARKAASFASGQAGFSFQLLIVFNLLGAQGWTVGLVRLEDVAIGAAISVVTATLLWPRGAESVLLGDLADGYEANAELLAADDGELREDGSAEELERQSLRAAAAGWRLDASLRQYLAERGRRLSYDDLGVLATGVARVRRDVTELRSGGGRSPAAPVSGSPDGSAAIRGKLAELSDWYASLGAAIRAGTRPPAPLPPAAPPPAPLPPAAGATADGALDAAWAHEHLAVLRSLVPGLAAACSGLAVSRARGRSAAVRGAHAP